MAGLAIAFVLLAASVVRAQDHPPDQVPDPPRAAEKATTIAVDKLPISLDRIQKKLATAPATTNISGLKLEYYIQVYGTAPRIDFFTGFDTISGPVPMSAPTHRDMLDMMTPLEFKAPVMDISGLIAWLTSKASR